jgi:hypothetical protein
MVGLSIRLHYIHDNQYKRLPQARVERAGLSARYANGYSSLLAHIDI